MSGPSTPIKSIAAAAIVNGLFTAGVLLVTNQLPVTPSAGLQTFISSGYGYFTLAVIGVASLATNAFAGVVTASYIGGTRENNSPAIAASPAVAQAVAATVANDAELSSSEQTHTSEVTSSSSFVEQLAQRNEQANKARRASF